MRFWIELPIVILTASRGGGSSSPTRPTTPSPPAGGTSSGTGSTLTALIDGAVWNQPNVIATYHQIMNPCLDIDSIDSAFNVKFQ